MGLRGPRQWQCNFCPGRLLEIQQFKQQSQSVSFQKACDLSWLVAENPDNNSAASLCRWQKKTSIKCGSTESSGERKPRYKELEGRRQAQGPSAPVCLSFPLSPLLFPLFCPLCSFDFPSHGANKGMTVAECTENSSDDLL